MTYAVSDIHGEYEAFLALLEKIHFSDNDELYVLGDCVDSGPEPVKLLQDMMARPNVYPIIGNHEYMALQVLRQLMTEITEESCDALLQNDIIEQLLLWQEDGGSVTLEKFRQLSTDEKYDILEYLEDEFSLSEQVTVNGKDFVLVHAGLDNFKEDRPLCNYALHEVIFHAPDYDKIYYKDKYLVTGHLPTISHECNSGQIISKNNHIAIDCGKVFGGNLSAICLDTMEEFYA